MLVDGKWTPTFPRARYLIGRKEWESKASEPDTRELLDDSVRPIFDAGLADLVESDAPIMDEIRLEPTPGHTPGHHSVRIPSRGQEAVITGDLNASSGHLPLKNRINSSLNADDRSAGYHEGYQRRVDAHPILSSATSTPATQLPGFPASPHSVASWPWPRRSRRLLASSLGRRGADGGRGANV
jgi:hypothetical protein